MKLDGLGVILAIILLPIILVVTYYIQMQVDTISKENEYNTILLSATYDAMSAFEMNTANEELSSVADSMRSLVLASNNVFLDSLATNMGMSNTSKEYVRPYIPAVLYTMYDGYYIYAPTETTKVAEKTKTDENGLVTTTGYLSVGDSGVTHDEGNHYKYDPESLDVDFKDTTNFSDYGLMLYEVEGEDYLTTDKEEAEKQTDYMLKSYVQYSARYKKGTTKDVTINYTLDNYLNIIGTIGNMYYTKTGYLIKKDLVTAATTDGTIFDLNANNENDAKNKILGLKTNVKETTIDAANSASVTVDGITINSNFGTIKNTIFNATGGAVNITTISEAEMYLEKFYETYDTTNNAALLTDIQTLEYEIQNCKAVAYYVSSACFSNWVYENLSDLTYNDTQDGAMTEYYKGTDAEGNLIYDTTSGAGADDLYYNFHNNVVKSKVIFDSSVDPESAESNFNIHKMEVIKNSIKYNLNLSISAYCKMNGSYEFGLPILLDEEWDKVLSNVSIVAFMQGLDCGMDIYNNYQIVCSTNNELTVTPSEMYYVKKSEFNNGAGTYHRIDCPYLAESSDGYISFKSKEVKYDKIYDKTLGKYKYDHRNLACYTCINNNNYSSLFLTNSDIYYEKIKSLKQTQDSETADSTAKKVAGYIALAKERQNIYKTNALTVSQGYDTEEITVGGTIVNQGNFGFTKAISLKNITELQITFAETKSNNGGNQGREQILDLTLTINGQNYDVSIYLDHKNEQTVTVNIPSANVNITSIGVQKKAPNYDVTYKIKGIKAIYK